MILVEYSLDNVGEILRSKVGLLTAVRMIISSHCVYMATGGKRSRNFFTG